MKSRPEVTSVAMWVQMILRPHCPSYLSIFSGCSAGSLQLAALFTFTMYIEVIISPFSPYEHFLLKFPGIFPESPGLPHWAVNTHIP